MRACELQGALLLCVRGAGEEHEQQELACELAVHVHGRRRTNMIDHDHGSAALRPVRRLSGAVWEANTLDMEGRARPLHSCRARARHRLGRRRTATGDARIGVPGRKNER